MSELQLGAGEDTPMSMAASRHADSKEVVCGVNSAQDVCEKGQNQNCRRVRFDANAKSSVPPRPRTIPPEVLTRRKDPARSDAPNDHVARPVRLPGSPTHLGTLRVPV